MKFNLPGLGGDLIADKYIDEPFIEVGETEKDEEAEVDATASVNDGMAEEEAELEGDTDATLEGVVKKPDVASEEPKPSAKSAATSDPKASSKSEASEVTDKSPEGYAKHYNLPETKIVKSIIKKYLKNEALNAKQEAWISKNKSNVNGEKLAKLFTHLHSPPKSRAGAKKGGK